MTLIALAVIYGIGALFFVWWDGGAVRRILIVACIIALAWATVYAHDRNLLPRAHSSVTRRT